MRITKDAEIKTLPAVLLVDCCDVHVSTLEQAARYGWIEYIAPVQELTEEELRVAAIPFAITIRQARLSLSRAGLLEAVDTLITQIGGDAVIAWEYASEVHRTNPIVAMVATQAGWTERQIDDLFTQAKSL